MAKERIVEFVDEGVIFYFPKGLDHVRVQKLKHIPDNQLPGPSGDFDPHRSVINVRLYDKDNDETLTSFVPPFRVKVYFNANDETSAGSVTKLKLAFHSSKDNNKNKLWERFTYSKHRFLKHKKQKGNWNGHGLATKVSTWPDPVMAWGP